MDPTENTAGSRALVPAGETSVAAVAAQAKAAVEARYIVAQRNKRDWMDVRSRLLSECARPRFAAVARYALPRAGKQIVGPSIRFAEAALRSMGNVYPEITTVYDDAEKRIVRVAVMDLEANVTYSRDVTIAKTVERSSDRGRTVVDQRVNSGGGTTYIVEATEDELAQKEASAVSRVMRGHALRLLPGDILDECMEKVVTVQRDADAADPAAARKALADAFAAMGVRPSDLAAYLGHNLESVTPAELTDLRGMYAGLRDGQTTWTGILEERAAAAHGNGTASGKGVAGVKARMKAEVQAETPTAPPQDRVPGEDDA